MMPLFLYKRLGISLHFVLFINIIISSSSNGSNYYLNSNFYKLTAITLTFQYTVNLTYCQFIMSLFNPDKNSPTSGKIMFWYQIAKTSPNSWVSQQYKLSDKIEILVKWLDKLDERTIGFHSALSDETNVKHIILNITRKK
ncbi:hypothetical protein BX661DRAFT_180555 [Kickxella alabastrina]|uniref:uncharacterized protein n=1 Tax=Kickxella alabastrina TaxID=61397 RepID=UPI00222124AF|nr:uncharacterized protein BX661DRAFT_180555 [Kickxella alabastrina]KAI7831054.1 hypothetical protein BX661DRAFT_180555 [Kickxella alabastrina]